MDHRPYLHEAKLRGWISTKGWLSLLKNVARKIIIAMIAFWLLLGVLYLLVFKRDGFLGSLNSFIAISLMGIASGLASMLQTRSLVFEDDRLVVSGDGQAEKTMTYKNMTRCHSIEINAQLEKWQFNSTEKPTIEFFVKKQNRSRRRCLEHLRERGVKWVSYDSENHSVPIKT